MSQPLYVDVADRIAELISNGTIKVGERIPSIRSTSRKLSVSVTTVIEAYRVLEDRGLVEPYPQSGFFVRNPTLAHRKSDCAPPEPEARKMSMKPTRVRVWNCFSQTLDALNQKDAPPLGLANSSPDLLPLEPVSRILARIVRTEPGLTTRYEMSPGNLSLRSAIASRIFNSGCTLGPEDIVVTTGTTEAMMLALHAVAKPGDAVAVESPCYVGVLHLLERLKLLAVELPTDPRDGVSLQAIEELSASSKSRVAAVILNPTVHNPLGGIMSDEKKRRVAEVLQRARIPLIEDDVYGDLAFSDDRPRCIKAFDKTGNVMLCSSFSKTIAPGYRVGWIAAGKWSSEVNELKLAFSLGSTTATQLAIAEYLEGRRFDRHLARLKRKYADQLKLLADAVGRFFPDGTKATRPMGGHVLWVELPSTFDTFDLYEQALEKNVSFAPGSIFSPTGRYRNCMRLNAGFPWSERLETAVRTLGGLLKDSTSRIRKSKTNAGPA